MSASTGTVDLKISSIHSLNCRGATADQSTFAQNGGDAQRIKKLLQSPPCECKCKLEFKVLYQCCRAFWSLPKESQDALLWSLQVEAGRRNKSWSIEGGCWFKYYYIIKNYHQKSHILQDIKIQKNRNLLTYLSVMKSFRTRCQNLQNCVAEVSWDREATNSEDKKKISRNRWSVTCNRFQVCNIQLTYFCCCFFFGRVTSFKTVILVQYPVCLRWWQPSISVPNCIRSGFFLAHVLECGWSNARSVSRYVHIFLFWYCQLYLL